MRFLCWLAFALTLWTSSAGAQVATITGQAVDSDSQEWFSGTYTIKWINPQPGFTAYRTDTLAPFPQSFLGSLDSTGSFSVNLTETSFIVPANSSWQFTICSAVTGWQCGTFTIPVTASGSVTSNISAVITAPRVTGGPGIKAYSDIEVSAFPNNSYFNLTSMVNRCYSTSWSVCQGGGGGGAVSSVFGRTGAVAAASGDYTCSEVTGCPTVIPVTSVFGRTGAITAQNGDYNCSQITGCLSSAPVTSVFGRVGVIVAQQGDYDCLQVTNCGAQPGFATNLAGNQGSTDTTMVIGNPTGWPTRGTLIVDSEVESFTARSGTTLSGITRGVSFTTPAAHTAGANISSIDIPFGDLQTQLPTGGIFGVGLSGGTVGQQMVLNCGSIPPVYGVISVFIANCQSNALAIDPGGSIHQVLGASGGGANFFSPFFVGGCYQFGECVGPLPIEVTNSTNLVQTTGSYQLGYPTGFTSSIYGPLKVQPVPNIPVPNFSQSSGGSCSITYDITGVDSDGNTVPGTPLVVNGLISGDYLVNLQVPLLAGIVTYYAYRSSVSGCGGLAVGQFSLPQSTPYPEFEDFGQTGDGTTPPSVNNSVAKMCVGSATNPELYCTLSGTSGTPPVSCTSSTAGWTYYITNAVSQPFSLQCISGTWTNTGIGGSYLSTAGAITNSQSTQTPTTFPEIGTIYQVDGFPAGTYAGAWSSTTAYQRYQTVTYSGADWIAVNGSTNVTPAAAAAGATQYWMQFDSTGSGLAACQADSAFAWAWGQVQQNATGFGTYSSLGLQFGSKLGGYCKNADWVMPTNTYGASISLFGEGRGETRIYQTASTLNYMLNSPNVSSSGGQTVSGITFDANLLAGGCLSHHLRRSLVLDVVCWDPQQQSSGTIGAAMWLGSGGDAYESKYEHLLVRSPAYSGLVAAYGTASVTSGAITSITWGGTGTDLNLPVTAGPGLVAYFTGKGASGTSYKPCGTMPIVSSIALTGGSINTSSGVGGITFSSAGATCGGTIYVRVQQAGTLNQAFYLNGADTTADDIVTSGDFLQECEYVNGPVLISHEHPYCDAPYQIETTGSGYRTHVAPQLDSPIQYGMYMGGTGGTLILGAEAEYNAGEQFGSGDFLIDAASGPITIESSGCNAGSPQNFGGYAKFTGTTTGIMTPINILPAATTSITGTQQNCDGSSTLWGTYTPPPTLYSAAGTALPTCTTSLKGKQLSVSDATSPTYLGAYTSGGAVVSPVMCNGSGWVTF